MNPIICEKGRRNHPLTEKQKAENRRKSKTRCLVEHVFGFEEQSMHGLIVRTIGIVRAKARCGDDKFDLQHLPLHQIVCNKRELAIAQ